MVRYVKSHHQAAAGFVLRDGYDIPILASTSQICYVDVLIVEAMTLCEGLRQAWCKGYDTIHVKGDSLLIQVINGKMHAQIMKLLVLDIYILKLAGHCAQIMFTHVFRKANFLADAITN